MKFPVPERVCESGRQDDRNRTIVMEESDTVNVSFSDHQMVERDGNDYMTGRFEVMMPADAGMPRQNHDGCPVGRGRLHHDPAGAGVCGAGCDL